MSKTCESTKKIEVSRGGSRYRPYRNRPYRDTKEGHERIYNQTGEVRSTSNHVQFLHNNGMIGGRLRHVYNVWAQITSDREVLQTVHGLQIKFANNLPHRFTYTISSNVLHMIWK